MILFIVTKNDKSRANTCKLNELKLVSSQQSNPTAIQRWYSFSISSLPVPMSTCTDLNSTLFCVVFARTIYCSFVFIFRIISPCFAEIPRITHNPFERVNRFCCFHFSPEACITTTIQWRHQVFSYPSSVYCSSSSTPVALMKHALQVRTSASRSLIGWRTQSPYVPDHCD